ncbi:hypothetical protein BV22DRAFT_980508, partial [Leucogyrophana mollusca]
VVIKNDRIYCHSLCRINYTGYDVRRGQDVLNPRTNHNNIMLLSGSDVSANAPYHPFSYARVLGIYHLNAIYIGPDTLDYQPHHIEVLWVSWDSEGGLHAVRFVPMAEDDAFGFVDPADVVQACHLIPAFARGKLHPDGVGMSHVAMDANDWGYYYVNRYV